MIRKLFNGREDFKKILKLFYQFIGWGADTRIPSCSKLLELNLSWLVMMSKIKMIKIMLQFIGYLKNKYLTDAIELNYEKPVRVNTV